MPQYASDIERVKEVMVSLKIGYHYYNHTTNGSARKNVTKSAAMQIQATRK